MATKNVSRASANSAVRQAADTLRSFAMEKEVGDFLGSEEELIEKLGVSRPTFRQASAQVLQENLISIRRGVGGGYFACQPDSMTVSRIAALYLQSRDAGLEEIILAVRPIRIEIARLAARNRDPEQRRELQAFVEGEEHLAKSGEYTYRTYLRSERDFGEVLGRMSGNKALTLFLHTLYDLAALLRRERIVLLHKPDRMDQYRGLRAQMARAILEGDEEIAIVATRRLSDVVTDWMLEDLASGSVHTVDMDAPFDKGG